MRYSLKFQEEKFWHLDRHLHEGRNDTTRQSGHYKDQMAKKIN